MGGVLAETATARPNRVGTFSRTLETFNLFVYRHLRSSILKSIPLAQKRAERIQRNDPNLDWTRRERRLARGYLGRATVLATLSSLPALFILLESPLAWVVALAGVLGATIWEASLGIKEQVRFTLGLFYLRGFRGDDEGLVELALFHVFGTTEFNRAAKAAKETLTPLARETGNELAESFLEIVAMQLSKRFALRITWRAAIRVAPLAGIVVGSAVSFAQARRAVTRILESLSRIGSYEPPVKPRTVLTGRRVTAQN